MSLNPLTLIDNLITEHGSSVIQGKHLALLKEQITILKEQRVESDRRNAELSKRAESLEVENIQLRQQLDELTAAGLQQRTDRRPETEEKILLLLTNRQKKTSQEIAANLGISQDRAEAYLSKLRDADLVGVQLGGMYVGSPAKPSLWYLGTDGQHYLVQHDLIQ